MGRRHYVPMRRHHDIPIRRHEDVSLRRLGDVLLRRRWVFHLRRTCGVTGTYRKTSLRRRHDVLLTGGNPRVPFGVSLLMQKAVGVIMVVQQHRKESKTNTNHHRASLGNQNSGKLSLLSCNYFSSHKVSHSFQVYTLEPNAFPYVANFDITHKNYRTQNTLKRSICKMQQSYEFFETIPQINK